MARALYGCTSADFTTTVGGVVVPGASLTVWSARTGGTRITDLLTVDGTPITEVVSGGDASIAYQGPDNDKSVHWADSGQGARTAIRPVDITGEVGPTGGPGPTGPPGASVGVLTTKGDLLVRDSGAGVRLPVGADNRVLTADASQAAGMRWATPTTRVGTGSPLGIVVPDFKGQKFVDAQQTLGAREWAATGTTTASWVVSDGDTGWFNLLPLAATITDLTVSRLDIRRIGKTVVLDMQVAAAALTSGTLLTAAQLAGWLPRGAKTQRHYREVHTVPGTQSIDLGAHSTLGLIIASQGNTNGNVRAEHSWTTADPWPTAAPV